MNDSERKILGLAIERYGAEAQTDMTIEENVRTYKGIAEISKKSAWG